MYCSGFTSSSIAGSLSFGSVFHLTKRRRFFVVGQLRIDMIAIRSLVTSTTSCSKQSYSGSKQANVVDRGLLQMFSYSDLN